MEKIVNWVILGGSLIGSITVILTAVNKILDRKLNGLYNSQRLQYRYEICSFAGDLRNGLEKTRGEYRAIFEMYDEYELLIEKLKQKNLQILQQKCKCLLLQIKIKKMIKKLK